MKKMKTKNKCLVTSLAIIAMLMMSLGVKAQNVTIRPDNGNLIVGQAGGQVTDSGIEKGLYAMWRHEQLALTMTTSDIGLQTSAGEMGDPSCGIGVYNGNLILAAGQTQTFVVVSLPKGFRITYYKLVLQPNLLGENVRGPHAVRDFILYHTSGNSQGSTNGDKGEMAFYETPAWTSPSPYGNDTHSTTLTCNDAIRTATATDGDQRMSPVNDANKEFVIERTSLTDDDMSNQLHFFFARSCSQYGVTIKSFEIYFNAQGTFDAEVEPTATGEATDYVKSPFTTGKMDIGAVKENASGIYTYDYTKVRDLIAYTHLYQDNTVADGVGKPVSVADGPKNIYPVQIDGKDVYAFDNDTYFIESPTEISTVTGQDHQPIGFRIVGAKFDYNWGTKTDPTTKTVAKSCKITVKGSSQNGTYAAHPGGLSNNGNTTFYLNSDLMFTTEVFTWEMDDVGNIGINLDSGFPQYLACFGEGDTRQLALSSSANGSEAKWNLRRADDGSLHYYSDGTNGVTNDYRLYAQRFQEGTPYHTRGLVTRTGQLPTGTNGGAVWVSSSVSQNETVDIPGFVPGEYTLKMYGIDKTTPVKTVTVSSAGDADSYTVTDLNNDAVNFEISGLTPYTENGKTIQPLAQVTVTLLMEALSPYIDKMDIVCHDDAGNLELTQPFQASDFSVSGGKFIFYVPDDYRDVPLTFTFSNLYSKYGDNTYYYDDSSLMKNGNSRYSYVTSNYFRDVDGSNDGGLYDTNYTPNSDYKKKVFTSTAGNVRFKFNNAEDIGKEGGPEYLIEDQFSAAKYLNNYPDPDGIETKADTIHCVLIANPSVTPNGIQYKKSDIFYVFTADETRYNIAPTTAWQHRSYAFYRMDIELEARTFTPKFTWEKIYDKTTYLYKKPQTQKNEQGQDVIVRDAQGNIVYVDVEDREDSMWGLTLDIEENVDGYLTYQEIIDNIVGREGVKYTPDEATAYNTSHGYNQGDEGYVTTDSWKIKPVTRQLKDDNSSAPRYMRQILYVDGTPLSAMLNSSENSIVKTLKDLKDSLAINNLVFLPEKTTSTLDNAVFETTGNNTTRSFRAGNNIVLVDKQPFYTPYTIKVDAASKATYTRQITQEGYGQDTNATLMLPFTLAVDGSGVHTNKDDGFSFSLNTMAANQTMDLASGAVDYGTAYFNELSGKETTAANVPYMVKVLSRDNTVADGDNISFVATQYGSDIVKTPAPTDLITVTGATGKFIQGETALAKYKGYSTTNNDYVFYDFTNYASYSGGKFDRALTENVFYFWKNKYVDLHTLYVDPNNRDAWRYLYSYPFRGVYTYKSSNNTFNSKMMKGFFISYDIENMEIAGITTDVNEFENKADLMIRSEKGMLIISASRDQDVNIRSINGMSIKNVNINAGSTQTVGLPSGIYLVNNIKITVK